MADPVSRGLILRRALAQYFEDQSIGVYRSDGTNYTATERGIFTNGPTLPTTLDNCLVLTSLTSIADGRANMVDRVQVFGRVKGNNIAAENLEDLVFSRLDQKEGVPPGLHISWAWRFSMLQFEPDTNARSSFAATYYFRGRR